MTLSERGLAAVVRRFLGRFQECRPATRRLYETLLALGSERDLDEQTIDELERLCQAFSSVLRQERRRRAGWTEARWDGKGPFVERGEHGSWYLPGKRGVVDHPYRMRHKGRGEVRYITEPYSLCTDGMRELLKLEEEGWDVSVTAWGATWFPGHTLAIMLGRRDQPGTRVA